MVSRCFIGKPRQFQGIYRAVLKAWQIVLDHGEFPTSNTSRCEVLQGSAWRLYLSVLNEIKVSPTSNSRVHLNLKKSIRCLGKTQNLTYKSNTILSGFSCHLIVSYMFKKDIKETAGRETHYEEKSRVPFLISIDYLLPILCFLIILFNMQQATELVQRGSVAADQLTQTIQKSSFRTLLDKGLCQ